MSNLIPGAVVAALNTANASWLERRLAKWFGRRASGDDGYGHHVTIARWRGKIYLIDYGASETNQEIAERMIKGHRKDG